MPNKPRKPRPPRAIVGPGAVTIVPAAQEAPELDGQLPRAVDAVEAADYSGLNHRQQAALPAVAFASSIAQAARFSGVAESTLRRWLADPDFRGHVDRMREETIHVANQELRGLLPSCAAVFADAMQSPDPSLRLRAARYAVSFILRLNEADRIAADLHDLEVRDRNS